MIVKMRTANVLDEINEGLDESSATVEGLLAMEELKRNRLVNLFAHLFCQIERDDSFVFRMVISPDVQILTRQLYKHDNFPFNEGTRKELVKTGLIANLWTADVYLDKDCVGVVLYSCEDKEKITDDHPSIKAKWDAIKKSEVVE